MKPKGGIITYVEAGSLAARSGLQPGDKILTVNNEKVNDLIDLNFALADENVEILIEDELGNKQTHYFQKRFGDHLGIEMESAVFDTIRQCANKCVFCFIDQMPEGMRSSLYVKDDDYRMSFLHGNFITLTNMGERDWNRIQRLHLSPLYISIHTTNGELRKKMMGHPFADRIQDSLRRLEESDIDFHGQVVMCPGYNDGAELEGTIRTLLLEFSNAIDVAIVPVGLTQFRDELATLEPITQQQALDTISLVEKWQKLAREKREYSFAYLADEFYLKAGVDFPPEEEYDGFHLLEDGIGMGRKFRLEWDNFAHKKISYAVPKKVALVTGTAVGDTMKKLVQTLEIDNLNLEVIPVENLHFGTTINVTGLLTYADITRAIKEHSTSFDALIIPGVCLRKGEPIFLDDKTIEDVENELHLEVRVCHFATDLLEQLYNWR